MGTCKGTTKKENHNIGRKFNKLNGMWASKQTLVAEK